MHYLWSQIPREACSNVSGMLRYENRWIICQLFPCLWKSALHNSPTNWEVEVDRIYNMSAIYEASESGRQHKSCWHSSISLRGLDVKPHQYSSALSNHLNAWSLSFMKMDKYAVHHDDSTWFHDDSTWFQSLFLLHVFQWPLNFIWLLLKSSANSAT